MTKQHDTLSVIEIPNFTFSRVADRMLAILSVVAVIFVFIVRNDPTPLLVFVPVAFVAAFFYRQHQMTIERGDISEADLKAAANTSKLVFDSELHVIKPRWFHPMLHDHLTTYVTRSDCNLSLTGPRPTVKKLAALLLRNDRSSGNP